MNNQSKVVFCVTDHEGKQSTQAYAGNMNSSALASHMKWVRSQPEVKFAHATIDGDPLVATEQDKASVNQWKQET